MVKTNTKKKSIVAKKKLKTPKSVARTVKKIVVKDLGNIGYYKRFLLINDKLTGESFRITYYALKDSASSSLPTVKIELPTVHDIYNGIEFLEKATLIENADGSWKKSLDIKFDKAAWNVLGVRGIVEESELNSVDVMTIAQVYDHIEKNSKNKKHSPRAMWGECFDYVTE